MFQNFAPQHHSFVRKSKFRCKRSYDAVVSYKYAMCNAQSYRRVREIWRYAHKPHSIVYSVVKVKVKFRKGFMLPSLE